MDPLRLILTFEIEQPIPADDLDYLAAMVREVIDEKIGETDYMIEDIQGYDITFELID